jgi:hypothetical protein
MPTIATLVAALVLALVHLMGVRLPFLRSEPRSSTLSLAGGVSVAYVFVHLLPELAESQRVVAETEWQVLAFLEHHAYLVALLGLATYYALERGVRQHRRDQGDAPTAPGVFWFHVAAFALYNAVIGYLLVHRERPGLSALIWYTVAMALHFLVTDYGLRQDHREMYSHEARWILVSAIMGGYILGRLTALSELAVLALAAFVSGGIILNVLKEELPEERESRLSAFVLGAIGYAAILVLT